MIEPGEIAATAWPIGAAVLAVVFAVAASVIAAAWIGAAT